VQEKEKKIGKVDAKTSMIMNMMPKLEILEFKARLGMHYEAQKFSDEYDASKSN